MEYAQKWYDSRNPDYYSYSADCANFVSQCLFAGGIQKNSAWHMYRGKRKKIHLDPRAIVKDQHRYHWDVTLSWSRAKDQFDFFSDSRNGYINGEVITITSKEGITNVANNYGVQIGDLLYFCGKDGTTPHHATIITEVKNGEIKYAGHTRSAFDKHLSKNIGNEQVKIIRLFN